MQPLARQAKISRLHRKIDFCTIIFDYRKQAKACRLFVEWLKAKGGSCTRREFNQFSYDMEQGKIEEGFTYSRKNFYEKIRRRLLDLGFLTFDYRFDYEKGDQVLKYVFVHQPIPNWRGPPGWSFYRLAWELCTKWNQEFHKR